MYNVHASVTILIAISYTILYLCFIYRTFYYIDFSKIWVRAKAMYFVATLHSFLRCSYFWVVLSISDLESKDSYLLIAYYSGEFMLLSIFLSVIWVLVKVYLLTHQSLDDSFYEDKEYSKYGHYSFFCSNLILVIGTCLVIAYTIGILNAVYFSIIIMASNFLCGGFGLMLLGYINNKFSKKPYKSTQACDIKHRSVRIMIYWAIARLVHGFFIMFDIFDLNFDPIDLIGEYYTSIAEIIDILISELICLYLILEGNYFRVFTKNVSDIEVTNSFLALINDDTSEFDIMEWKAEDLKSILGTEAIIPTDLKMIRTLYSEKHKLGEIHLGVYKNKSIIIKRIVIPEYNSYLLEDLKQEIKCIKRVEDLHILPLIGAIIQPPIIDLIHPYIVNGSLHSALHTKSMIFSFKEKLRIAKEIAIAMRDLHQNGHIHGHLTSYNILLSPDWKILISDLGLNQLKKFAGLTIGYCNKSAWSSPEQLRTSSSVILNPSITDDVYSFGMILWEIFTQKQPYQGFEWKKLRRIVIGGYTPGVPRSFKESIKDILIMCWSSDPLLRPSFSKIAYQISKIENID